ncbi:MAG: hypothetical protein J6B71_09510 [Clostridia bacterium]|nr:hypothetical protein [Clostridia bacterium]
MKRILASILATVMILSCMTVFTFAETTNTQTTDTAVWSGEIDYTWMVNDPDATEYTLTTPEQFAGFAALVSGGNKFAGKTVKLGADMILNTGNAENWATTAPANIWTTIGNDKNPFQGIFDGQGHTISGMYVSTKVTSVDNLQQGLFAVLSSTSGDNINPTLRNFSLVNSYMDLKEAQKPGLVVGQLYTAQKDCVLTIENIYAQGYIRSKVDTANGYAAGVTRVGGICGVVTVNNAEAQTVFRNLVSDVDITALAPSTANAGGLLAYLDSKGDITIENCVNLGDVTADTRQSGGLIAHSNGKAQLYISNCLNVGAVISTADGDNGAEGGLIGRANKPEGTYNISNCITLASACAPVIGLDMGVTINVTNCFGIAKNASNAYESSATEAQIKGANALTTIGATYANGWRAFENDWVLPVTAAIVMGKITLPANRLAAVQETAVANGKIAVRLIGTVDGKNYKNVGFDVKVGSAAAEDKSATSVFNSVAYGTGETAGKVGKSTYFANYVYGVILPEISASGTVVIEATPYVTAANGTKTASATTWVITYVDGVYTGTTTK